MMEGNAGPRLRSLLSTLPEPATKRDRAACVTRAAIATLASIAAAIAMRSFHGHIPHALWIPTVLLVLAGVLAHHGEVGSQLVARSVWWANLVLGLLLSLVGSSWERELGLVLTGSTGIALLTMGRLGLDEDERSAFRPVAFRTTLTLGMIMAVADAQALTLFGALSLEDTGKFSRTNSWLLLLSALLLVIAIIGLYRLRVWGLLLAALTAALVAGLAFTGAYGFDGALAAALGITSLVQIALPAPIVLAIVRGRAPAASASPSRLARAVPALVIVTMVGVSAYGAFLGFWRF